MKHPDSSRWIEFVEGSLANDSREELESHLAACETCRTAEQFVRRVMNALASSDLPEPSGAALRTALRSFRSSHLPAGIPEHVRKLGQLVVDLVFDSFAHPERAFAGARTGSLARRLRFESESLELDVLVEAQGDRRRLTAQLLGLKAAAHPIADVDYWVSVNGQLTATGITDDQGGLTVEIGTGEIEILLVAGGSLSCFRIPETAADPANP